MDMTEMIVCGLSMEMESAKEHNGIGKCSWCWYLEYEDYCRKKDKKLLKREEDCNDWVVDMR